MHIIQNGQAYIKLWVALSSGCLTAPPYAPIGLLEILFEYLPSPDLWNGRMVSKQWFDTTQAKPLQIQMFTRFGKVVHARAHMRIHLNIWKVANRYSLV